MKDVVLPPRDDRDMGTPVSTSETMITSRRRRAEALPDNMEAFGSCRLCLVEIEGRRGTPASCTTPVSDRMVVNTQTDKLRRLRNGVM